MNLKDKKYNFYQKKQKDPEEYSEYDYLIKKKQVYTEKLSKQEENLEKRAKLIAENEKKINTLEKEYKELMKEAGDDYLKANLAKALLDKKNQKLKIINLLEKQGNSNLNSLALKEKSLKIEMKELKEKALEMNSKISLASKEVNKYQEKISLTPIIFNNKSLTENRSFSVRTKNKMLYRLDY